MSKRRPFGTVRKLASGRWQARYRTGTGQRLGAPETFATKTEATRWLSMVEADQTRGLWIDPSAGKVTLGAYSHTWLEGKVRISPRTREMYALQLRLHILPMIKDEVPALGRAQLGQLTPEWVRAWYAAVAATRSPSVAAKAYVRLRQVLRQAVDDDRIPKNPCRIDGGGVERHAEQRFVTLVELYELAAAVPDRYRALVLAAGYTGLRQGELFALRRRDVDMMHGSVSVHRKRIRLASGEVVEDAPKSEAGRRKVAMPAPLVTELQRHLTAYTDADADAFVVTSSTGQPVDPCNFRSRVWLPAARATGLGGLRFHDLRHTAGTLAARTGATPRRSCPGWVIRAREHR